MKTKTLIKKIKHSLEPVEFVTKGQGAAVVIHNPFPDNREVRVYIGDGDDTADYQYMCAADLREVAKKFTAVADALEAGDAPSASADL